MATRDGETSRPSAPPGSQSIGLRPSWFVDSEALVAEAETTFVGSVKAANDLRVSADRSWLSARTTFPTVASPALPDEPTHDDDHLREGHPEVDHPPSPLRAPHKLFVG
jgi:hypothetical protein